MKYIASSVIERKYRVEILPEIFHGMSEEEYLKEFSDTFYEVDNMSHIVEYIINSISGRNHVYEEFIEGVGWINCVHPVTDGEKKLSAVVKIDWGTEDVDVETDNS